MSIKSKEAYLKKLRMILLFFFKEEEVRSIIYDYEERLEFTQESVNMPDIQHSSLKIPWRECREILAEAEISPIRAFLTQKKFKIFLMLLLFTLSSGYVAMRCEKSSIDFLLPAFIINFIVYIMRGLIDTEGIVVRQKFSVINILLLVYTCFECLMIGLYIPKRINHNVGAIIACVIVTIAVILVLMIVMIMAGSGEIQGNFLLMHHIITIVLNTLYFISQMGILQEDISSFSFNIISGAIYIYGESIILYLLTMGVKRVTKKYGCAIKTRNS